MNAERFVNDGPLALLPAVSAGTHAWVARRFDQSPHVTATTGDEDSGAFFGHVFSF